MVVRSLIHFLANLPSAALDADDKGLNAEQSSADLVGRPRARSFWMSGSATKCSSELGEGFQKNSKRGCSVTYGYDSLPKLRLLANRADSASTP